MTGFQVGDLIENRYRVLIVNETGGMGTLYRVSDEAQGSEIIALKTVRLNVPAAEAPRRIEYFQREFQTLTQLHHPNLVSVYDYGIMTEGKLYFTMEWVEGQDLEPDRHSLSPEATIPVMVQVCRALAYLHLRGVIHGDLKPANILLLSDVNDQRHRVKIVDFGLAGEVRSPRARARYYSPGYSAPEVREQRPVDLRSDLYSLGALWYALLVGEPPMFMFGADQLIQFALDEVLEAQEQIPAALGDVIARLLATLPENRYASADEVIEAVNEITGSGYKLETRETASSYALRTQFVNREAEMEMLQMMWEQTKAGAGKLILISGESGLGKTRLVEELEIQAELEGARVVWGQCVESGGSAYQPWREVLRVLMRYLEGAGLLHNEGLDINRVGPVLAGVLPELWERDYMADLKPPVQLAPQAAQQRLHSAIVQTLREAAVLRSTMIVMENAQWADEATLAMLSFMTHTVEQTGVLVCVTYRSDEIDVENPLVRIAGDQVLRIPMQTLSPECTTDLACSMLGREELPTLLMEQLQWTTGGNAFFVQELIRSLAAEGEVLRRTVEGWQVDQELLKSVQLPESIHQVVERRLTQLSLEAQQMLSWAAVMGIVCWEGGIAEIGGGARSQIRATLPELVDLKLLVVRDESAFAGEREYLFLNPTVWEVSYESIPQEERRGYHDQVAAWLMAHSAEEMDEHFGLIADHLEKAGRIEQAITYLTRAGEQAVTQFANTEAIRYLSRALALTPQDAMAERYDTLLIREKAYDLQGTREAQKQDLTTLDELALAVDDGQPASRRRMAVALRQANYAEAIGDFPATITAAQQAIQLAQAIQDVDGEARGYLQVGIALWQQGDYTAAQPPLEQALTLARMSGARKTEADSLYNLGAVPFFQGKYVECQVLQEQALLIYHEIGDRQGESNVLNNLGAIFKDLGDYGQAREYYEQGLRVVREIGERRVEGHVLGGLSMVHIACGNYAKSKIYVEQSQLIHLEIGDRTNECAALTTQSRLAYYLQDDEAARKYSQQALLIARQVGSRRWEGYALTCLGHALVSLSGRSRHPSTQETSEEPHQLLAGAADAYHQAMDIRRELGQPNLVIESLAGLARVLLAQDDLTQAQVYVEEILDHLESNTSLTSPMHALDGTSEPLLIYLTCYRVLQAVYDRGGATSSEQGTGDQYPRARAILQTAYHLLQEQAAKIDDEEIRRSFLENVAAHREIVDEWEQMSES
ncbi:MAG: tetratricopeptide repeat protein [Chloroflexi bacterium]|nr:tetratricopeptide repeat protein [Chloroflexota bacterium]